MKTADSLGVGTRSKPLTVRVATVFMVLSVVMLPAMVNHAQQLDMSQQALIYAAQINNLPLERLAIANTAWLRAQIFRAKVVDNATGEIYLVNLHSAGAPATNEEVNQLLRADLERGLVGKIQATLRARVDAAPTGASSINIWVRTPQIPTAAWHSALEQGRRVQVFNEAAALHLNAETPVLQFLHNLGLHEKYASQYAPVVSCQVPNSVLAQLETLPEVSRVYGDERAVPALNTAIPTIKAQKVWNQNVTGYGVRIATVEALDPFSNNNNAIANDNPFVAPVTYFDLTHTQSSRHATEVAGVIASTDVTYRGVSYGVARPSDLLNGNPSDGSVSGLNTATSWAASQNASIINQSYGSGVPTGYIGVMGVYDDYVVDVYLTTITVASGNNYTTFVDDPAVAFNVIAVGAFDHHSNSSWADDEWAGYSSFLNPNSANGDREKPEIAAPGNVYTTWELSTNSWITPFVPGGTSLAAPHVAGTAALLMQAKPSLKTSPGEVKAILMASAVHNIEGASRLSDRDGAGGLHAKAAYDTVVNGWSSKISYVVCQGKCSSVDFKRNCGAGRAIRDLLAFQL